jgi:hypothetical protein
MIEIGDIVEIHYVTYPAFIQSIIVTAQVVYVPVASGDFWYFEYRPNNVDVVEFAQNPMSSNLEAIILVKKKDGER